MGMWRVTTKEEKTMLYILISRAVKNELPHKMPARQKNAIIASIFKANKEYYDVHLMQMQEFISKQS